MKIGIIRCQEHSNKCAGYNCFPAIVKRSGKFAPAAESPAPASESDAPEGQELELVGFDSCGGCARGTADRVVERAKKLRDRGVSTIYLGNCTVSACPWADLFCGAIEDQVGVKVVRGTH